MPKTNITHNPEHPDSVPERWPDGDRAQLEWALGLADDGPSPSLLRDMRHRIELIATIMTILAALLAGWSLYESQQWHNSAVKYFSEANVQLTNSVQLHIRSDALAMVDLMDFQDWLAADNRGDMDAAAAIEQRFSNDFKHMFFAWRGLSANDTRNKDDVDFALAKTARANNREANAPELMVQQAKATFVEAEGASKHASSFLVAGALFGLAMLFGVISQRMGATGLQIAVLLCSELFTLAGVSAIVALPTHFGV